MPWVFPASPMPLAAASSPTPQHGGNNPRPAKPRRYSVFAPAPKNSPPDPIKIIMTSSDEPTMPFDKYKGKPISQVFQRDPSYLAWFCNTVDGNEGLKWAIYGLAGRPEAFRKCLASRAQPIWSCAEETFCIDPRLSREDLDRLCRESLNPPADE